VTGAWQGELVRVTQQSHKHKAFYFHLLSDMIIYSVPLRNGTYRFHRQFPFTSGVEVVAKVRFGGKGGLHPVKDFANYEAYAAQANMHKRVSLMKRLSKAGPELAPVPAGGAAAAWGRREAAEDELAVRAFKVRSVYKTITLYAKTDELKKKWVKAIRGEIKKSGACVCVCAADAGGGPQRACGLGRRPRPCSPWRTWMPRPRSARSARCAYPRC
jgi:hypothetical protein